MIATLRSALWDLLQMAQLKSAPLRGAMRSIRTPQVIFPLLAVIAGTWIAWIHAIRTQTKVLEREAAQLEKETALLATYSQLAQSQKDRLALALNEPRRVLEKTAAPGMAPALSSIVNSMAPEIELLSVRVRTEADNPGELLLQVEGASTGPAPRVIADGFRLRLERELKREPQRVAVVSFDHLDDGTGPPAAGKSEQHATFTISAQLPTAAPARSEL